MNNKYILSVVALLFCGIIGILYYTYSNRENKVLFALNNEIGLSDNTGFDESLAKEDTDTMSDGDRTKVSNTISSIVIDNTDDQIIGDEVGVVPIEVDIKKANTDDLIVVFLYGCIKTSGIYKLNQGSRVYEAVEMAGGLSAEADIGYVNQARLLIDGESIYFPNVEEAKELPAVKTPVVQELEVVTETQKMININTASASELITLPGIGASRAADIIAYREKNGKFTKAEDIMKVSGIKEAIFTKLKDMIRVD